MTRPMASAVGVTVLVVLGLATLWLLGMRTKWPLVIDTQRRINRTFINPRTMKAAGTPGATASIVRHTGRTTGKSYETPVGPFATDDGFVIVLPYGTRPDWLRNVMAAGSATIVRDGTAYRVDRLEILPIQAADAFLPEAEKRSLRLFGVDQCLRVRHVQPGSGAGVDRASL
jgi:deazaflavin-dependent oxidoreductase (nitroreductase family)